MPVVGGYTIKHNLGKGSFGKVFCAVKADTGEAVALKFVLACGSIRLSSRLKAVASFMNVLLLRKAQDLRQTLTRMERNCN